MRKPSIYDIKYAVTEKSPHYFSRNTMRHFGQTLKSFTVRRVGDRVFIYAPGWDGKRTMPPSFREFTGDNLVTVKRHGEYHMWASTFEIDEYLNELEEEVS